VNKRVRGMESLLVRKTNVATRKKLSPFNFCLLCLPSFPSLLSLYLRISIRGDVGNMPEMAGESI
jgi:hypothetical protein